MRIRNFPIIFAALLWPLGAAHASGPQPGNLNHQETRRCSEQDFIVWGEFDNLRVLRGQNNWTAIDNNEVIMFCGRFDQAPLLCPVKSKYVWVTRSGEFDVFLACYFD